jgi:hypothetical protein
MPLNNWTNADKTGNKIHLSAGKRVRINPLAPSNFWATSFEAKANSSPFCKISMESLTDILGRHLLHRFEVNKIEIYSY